MRDDVIAKACGTRAGPADAEIIDLNTGGDAATQVGALVLTASLLHRRERGEGAQTCEEMAECLTTPLREPTDFLAAVRSTREGWPGTCIIRRQAASTSTGRRT